MYAEADLVKLIQEYKSPLNGRVEVKYDEEYERETGGKVISQVKFNDGPWISSFAAYEKLVEWRAKRLQGISKNGVF